MRKFSTPNTQTRVRGSAILWTRTSKVKAQHKQKSRRREKIGISSNFLYHRDKNPASAGSDSDRLTKEANADRHKVSSSNGVQVERILCLRVNHCKEKRWKNRGFCRIRAIIELPQRTAAVSTVKHIIAAEYPATLHT
jgi:hypothetical protein